MRFGINSFFILIIATIIIAILGGGESLGTILLISMFLGFGIPFALDDMGLSIGFGVGMLLIPFLWFFIGAIIGWMYGLIKEGGYKVFRKILIIIILVSITLGLYIIKGGLEDPFTKAVRTGDTKICDNLEENDNYKELCYIEIGRFWKDYSICEQSKDKGQFKESCMNAVAETLGECEKIQQSWEKYQCYSINSIEPEY